MFRWKNYVYEIYKERSFTKAAQNLYVSQPSLSARIKKIEEDIGAPLFDRSTTPLLLTDIGELYIKTAVEIMKLESDFENGVNDISGLHSGHLHIGASNAFAAYLLPPIVTAFKILYPGVKITLTEGNTATLKEMLSTNELDMVVDNNSYDDELYDRELCHREVILLAVPGEFPECDGLSEYEIGERDMKEKSYLSEDFPAVPINKFKDIPFVLLSQGNDTRTRSDAICSVAGFRPRAVLELNQQATAYMTASTGIGAAFVSDTIVSKLPLYNSFNYYKIGIPTAKRNVYFYFKKSKFITGAMSAFLTLIKDYN